jgi:hypothetical protein
MPNRIKDGLEFEKVRPLGPVLRHVILGARLGRLRPVPTSVYIGSLSDASLLRVRRGGRGKMMACLLDGCGRPVTVLSGSLVDRGASGFPWMGEEGR